MAAVRPCSGGWGDFISASDPWNGAELHKVGAVCISEERGWAAVLKCEYFVSLNTDNLPVVWKQPCSSKQPLPAGAGSVCWAIPAGVWMCRVGQEGEQQQGWSGSSQGLSSSVCREGREGSRGILRTPGLPLLTEVVEKVVWQMELVVGEPCKGWGARGSWESGGGAWSKSVNEMV